MRIDPYRQISLNKLQKEKNNKKKDDQIKSQKDKLAISKQAIDMTDIKKKLEQTPDVRKEKIAELKAQIQNGTYQIDAREVAKKILANFKRGE
ncbi:MAG: flagellar biosynthesis anti-sigma factor FlgM [bacterium]